MLSPTGKYKLSTRIIKSQSSTTVKFTVSRKLASSDEQQKVPATTASKHSFHTDATKPSRSLKIWRAIEYWWIGRTARGGMTWQEYINQPVYQNLKRLPLGTGDFANGVSDRWAAYQANNQSDIASKDPYTNFCDFLASEHLNKQHSENSFDMYLSPISGLIIKEKERMLNRKAERERLLQDFALYRDSILHLSNEIKDQSFEQKEQYLQSLDASSTNITETVFRHDFAESLKHSFRLLKDIRKQAVNVGLNKDIISLQTPYLLNQMSSSPYLFDAVSYPFVMDHLDHNETHKQGVQIVRNFILSSKNKTRDNANLKWKSLYNDRMDHTVLPQLRRDHDRAIDIISKHIDHLNTILSDDKLHLTAEQKQHLTSILKTISDNAPNPSLNGKPEGIFLEADEAKYNGFIETHWGEQAIQRRKEILTKL